MIINPFADPEYLVDYGLKGRDVISKEVMRDKKGETLPAIKSITGDGLVSKIGSNLYLFMNIPYNGKIVPALEFTTKPLCNGVSKTQRDWVEFSKNSRVNPEGWSATDAEILYQVMRRAVDLRANLQYKRVVQEFVGELRLLFDNRYFMTLSKVSYGQGLDAVVSSLAAFPGNASPQRVSIPEFQRQSDYWSYLTLANKQSENQLGTRVPIPQNTKDGLQAILGESYETAATVFQHIASRTNRNLKEVRFWTPTVMHRNAEWMVTLGASDSCAFDLSVIDSGMPVFGVRAQKIFSGSVGGRK